ncbi:MAG: hypothetical protein E6R03_14235 [Hyphomicrobiaceae bacterium]|nr:MAG: hypothetical protein E6R03_14235 [Hyphomicrobiaceae bacterium]
MRKQMPAIPKEIAAGFPLSWHAGVGQFMKKCRQKQYYFGVDPRAALEKFTFEWPYISTGKAIPELGGFTVEDLCIRYMDYQKARQARKEINRRFLSECLVVAEFLATKLGPVDVSALKPSDFEDLRQYIRGTPAIVGNKIGRVKAVFKYGFDQELIDKPVRFGVGFKAPTRSEKRRHKAAVGDPILSRDEVLRLLEKASPLLKAAILLGINGGMYASDVSEISHRHLQGEQKDWVVFARPKTGIGRQFWLWPETREAIEAAKSHISDRLFCRRNGEPLVKHFEDGHRSDVIGTLFWKLKKSLGIVGANKGFKAFRHTYRTVSDRQGDQPAIVITMGHVDAGISAEYRHLGKDSEPRIRAVGEFVRQWLFGEQVLDPVNDPPNDPDSQATP